MRSHIAHAALERALSRTAAADRLVRSLLQPYRDHARGLLVLATGGYARADLAPHSDLDLVVIVDDPDHHPALVRGFVQDLWNSPYRPAQTVIALDDLDGRLFTIPDRASSLLETRVVWGDVDLATGFERRVNELINSEVFDRYVEHKQQEFTARRARFGAVARVVEPHLKNEAGGFRDLHHVFWLELGRQAQRNHWRLRRTRGNLIRAFAGRLRHDHLLLPWEADELVEAYGFLLAVRELLHEHRGAGEDRLMVDDQPKIAHRLGYPGGREAMTSLMRDVYHSTQKHSRFCEEFGSRFAFTATHKPAPGIVPALVPAGRPGELSEPVQPAAKSTIPGCYIAHDRLELSPAAIHRHAHDPASLLQLVENSVREGTPLSGRSRHSLRRALHGNPGARQHPGSWSSPLQPWFELSAGVAQRLRCLDELDAISFWMPEWREIAGLTTGSHYHRYTVDEHTMRALEILDHLPDGGLEGDPRSLWEHCEFRSLVYLSLLFHDIAKGRPGDHSNEGAAIARTALPRFGMDRWVRGVAKLVRIHLLMEQTAFRRDFSDPAVLGAFTAEVGDEQSLAALYLLTVCDLSAVRAGVWTSWKGRLLSELFLAARDVLRHGIEVRRATVAQEVARVAPHLAEHGNGRDRAQEFISALEEDYRRNVPAAEIAVHLEAVESLQRGRFEFQWLIGTQPGFVVLTLITRDRPGLLSDIAGLLTVHGIGIREARVFTRADGVVIDRFRCEDIEPTHLALEERLNRIPGRWGQLQTGELRLRELFVSYRRRSRFDHAHVGLVEAEIAVRPLPGGAMVDVSGPDSVGLLHRLCSELARSGYEIRGARVTGRLDGIMDSFLVRDPGHRLEKPAEREELMRRLRDAAGPAEYA